MCTGEGGGGGGTHRPHPAEGLPPLCRCSGSMSSPAPQKGYGCLRYHPRHHRRSSHSPRYHCHPPPVGGSPLQRCQGAVPESTSCWTVRWRGTRRVVRVSELAAPAAGGGHRLGGHCSAGRACSEAPPSPALLASAPWVYEGCPRRAQTEILLMEAYCMALKEPEFGGAADAAHMAVAARPGLRLQLVCISRGSAQI